MAFTCVKCETKQARTFSKESYEKGVVLVRCEGCDKLHLIADNLGWFNDEKTNI
jgi:protein import protein ZIM17